MKLQTALVIVLGFGAVACVSNPDVIRIYSGKEVVGPFITPEAYAHYMQGVIDEAHGKDADAAGEYAKAAEEDPDSPDIWTRLAAAHCRMHSPNSEVFFERAEKLDKEYAPLWRERAQCALGRGDAKHARDWARFAVTLDPDDEVTTLVFAEAESKLARKDIARRWLEALIARDPTNVAAKTALARLGASSRLEPAAKTSLNPARPTLADVDRALIEETPRTAHDTALKAGVPLDTLAIRAAALGKFEIARTEAERALAADPGSADAWVAALVAADTLRDSDRFTTALRALGAEPINPSPLAARLLFELIERRVGKDAARAFRENLGPLPDPADDLERRVATRAEQ